MKKNKALQMPKMKKKKPIKVKKTGNPIKSQLSATQKIKLDKSFALTIKRYGDTIKKLGLT